MVFVRNSARAGGKGEFRPSAEGDEEVDARENSDFDQTTGRHTFRARLLKGRKEPGGGGG